MITQTKKPSPKIPSIELNEQASKLQEEIRVRAYELYEHRGRQDGHELDDWLQSESEVLTKRKTRQPAA